MESPDESFTKERYIWQISALRLLRERACVQYARQVVPRVVDEVSIEFPDTEIDLGLRVAVRSQRLEGRALLPTLYEEEKHGIALDVGRIALEALHRADVSSAPFGLFSRVYRLVRGPRAMLGEMLHSPLLSLNQRRELRRLVARYMVDGGGRKVLVHGDLQPAHLIFSSARKSLGYIDLEAMHVGKAATNFAQLWIGFHFADPALGQKLYRRFREQSSHLLDECFDADVRAEIALRSYSHIRQGRRQGLEEMEGKARLLLGRVLSGTSFREMCLEGTMDGNAKGIR
jgi:aminoglycoside phosphotransferase (APT) family kinase protein